MSAQIVVSEDLDVPPEVAFSRLCAVETWPVWMSFVKRAALNSPSGTLQPGADVHLWSELSHGDEEIYEIDVAVEPYQLIFVGAYSCRRRIEFAIEPLAEYAKITMRVCWHVHGGAMKASLNRMTQRRRLVAAIEHSMETFKGLVEHDASDRLERTLA